MCGCLSRWYIRLYLIRVTICLVLHCMHYSLPNKFLIGRLGLLAVFLLQLNYKLNYKVPSFYVHFCELLGFF